MYIYVYVYFDYISYMYKDIFVADSCVTAQQYLTN